MKTKNCFRVTWIITLLLARYVHAEFIPNSSMYPIQHYADLDVHKKTSLRILMFIDIFPWYTKEVITNQIIGLLQRGHEVFIYSVNNSPVKLVSNDVKKYRLLERTYYRELPTDLHTYDIIIFQYGFLAKRFMGLLKQVPNIKAKFVTFFRGSDITAETQIRDNEYKKVFQIGDLFLPVCEYFRYRLILLGCDPKKIFVLPSGINCDHFKFKERNLKQGDVIRILSVGRMVPKKAFRYCIEAFSKIIEKFPDAEYIIVGDGPLRSELEELVEELGLERNVHLPQWKNQDELVHIFETSHIFLFTPVTSSGGTQEGVSNVLKEAQLSGMPVIASFHGGNIELVRNWVNGFLIPERDSEMLNKRLLYLMRHPQLWSIMGRAGRNYVKEKFDMNVINNYLEKILVELVSSSLQVN